MENISDWKTDVLHLISGCSIDDVNPVAARKIIIEHLPHAIYKYRSVNDNSLQNLRDSTVWMASPAELNDPFDTAHTLEPSKILSGQIKKLFKPNTAFSEIAGLVNAESIAKVQESDDPTRTITEIMFGLKPRSKQSPGLDQYVEAFSYAIRRESERMIEWSRDSIRDGVKLCSFSEVGDEVLMWSHYTKDHSGFCIEWDLHQDENRNALGNLLHPVVYIDELFDMTDHLFATIQGKQPNPLLAIASGIRKSKTWSYEKEWRLFFPIGPGTPSYNFRMPKPSKVLLGAKIESEDRKMVEAICVGQGIPTKQMHLSPKGYSLIQEE